MAKDCDGTHVFFFHRRGSLDSKCRNQLDRLDQLMCYTVLYYCTTRCCKGRPPSRSTRRLKKLTTPNRRCRAAVLAVLARYFAVVGARVLGLVGRGFPAVFREGDHSSGMTLTRYCMQSSVRRLLQLTSSKARQARLL